MVERLFLTKILFFGKTLTFVKDYGTMDVEKMNKDLSQCKKGNHCLIAIYEEDCLNEMGVSVKWCKKCGSVVADGLCDGRDYPGRFVKMQGPEIYQPFRKM